MQKIMAVRKSTGGEDMEFREDYQFQMQVSLAKTTGYQTDS
jgi:hypothetical protein